MTRKSKAELRYDALLHAQKIFVAADLTESTDFDYHPDYDDPEPDMADDSGLRPFSNEEAAIMLRYIGLTWLQLAESLSSEGARRPYHQFRRPTDFFKCLLEMPDRYFRSVFRCVVDE